MNEPAFEITNLSKHFSGVKALDEVSFDILKGTCHCIVGENGAGKSTLIKILTGAYTKTSGMVKYNGREFNPTNTRESMKAGIGCLFQELNVVEQLRVIDNIYLGIEDTKFGIIRKKKGGNGVFDIIRKFDATIAPNTLVEELSVAQRQIVEIAKALTMESDVIIMDEPTASLSSEEVRRLFEIIEDLKQQGVTVIYISHRLSEIFEIADTITVLRDGKEVGTKPRSEIHTRQELIKMMIGKVIVEDYVPGSADYEQPVVQVTALSNQKLNNISFELFKGEVLGFYGLIGAGKTEIARVLFGIDKHEGRVKILGSDQSLPNPSKAIKAGIALVPEERRTQGLCTTLAISANIPMMNYETILSGGLVNNARQGALARKYIGELSIASRNENQTVSFLSGGNQQKVVFAKCFNSEANILLLDEPTRGVDVGAKQEIYAIIRQLAKEGISIIVFSSELPEVLGLCDRIGLLYDGKLKGMMNNDDNIDSHEIMHIVTGGS